MKQLLSAALSLVLASAAAAQSRPVVAQDDNAPGRPTLRRRDPAPENSGPAQPGGGLEQRLADLSQQISREMSDNQKRTIAVVEFADLKGRVTDFGRFLSEELITRLYQTRKFKVIERQLLNKVISEQKLSLTGIIDQTSAQKLGRLLGVEAIASGSVSDLGKSLRVNARLIDTGTAEVFAVASTEIVKDDAVARLMGAEDAPTGGGGGGAAAPPPAASARRIDAQFFTFELQQCRISGSVVICDLVVTNNDKDRELGIFREGTGLIDDSNNTFMVQGLEDITLANASGSFYSGKAERMLVAGVPTKARVVVKDVSPQAKKLSVLGIRCDAGGEFRVRFRDVPLLGASR